MYAIIQDGTQQYKVEEGQQLDLAYRTASPGDELRLDRVLAVGDEGGLRVGQPLLEAAVVTAEVLSVVQGPKLVVQKFRRRKTYRRKTGHRQLYTRVKVNKIALG